MKSLQQKAQVIQLLICDMDGVLTDGTIMLTHDPQQFHIAFSVQDGLGIQLLRKHGIEVAVITASPSPIVDIRMKQLGIQHYYKGQQDKNKAYDQLLSKLQLTEIQTAYIGDDIPDLSSIRRSGLGITVPNATSLVFEHADWVTTRSGGHGAVREVADFLLSAQGFLPQLT